MPFSESDKIIITHYRVDKGYSARRLLLEFPDKEWSRSGLDKLIKKIDEQGSAERKEGSGRPRTVRTEENVVAVAKRIKSIEGQPGTHMSPAAISRELGLSETSVRRMVKDDLHLKPFKRMHGQKLSEVDQERRVERSKKMLRSLTADKLSRTFFTDEKMFMVDPPLNSQNDRVYDQANKHKHEIEDQRLFRTMSCFTRKIMVSVGVSKLGKTSLHFIEPGVKVDGAYYRETLLANMLPEMSALARGGHFVFQQDGARSHTARESVAYLEEHVPELLKPEMWPANSPDLNPVDYTVWSWMEQKVYTGEKIRDIPHLRRKLSNAWEELPQTLLDDAIDQFRPRLKKVIEVGGLHIEQFFK